MNEIGSTEMSGHGGDEDIVHQVLLEFSRLLETEETLRLEDPLVQLGLDSLDVVEILQVMEESGGSGMIESELTGATTMDDLIFLFIQGGGNMQLLLRELQGS